ncbi:translation initiation factor SUI1 [Pelomyxa schiedti]|nr:translation initiation factor SUI1 [Pelomyxa schiedti]
MSATIQNLSTKDPFADADLNFGGPGAGKIHIRIQQRNGKKSLTTVTGLPDDLDHARILKAFKKLFSCNGSIVQDEKAGTVIQLQGDHRQHVCEFLTSEGIADRGSIAIHGF